MEMIIANTDNFEESKWSVGEMDAKLMARVNECWNSLEEFREGRERNKRFTYGDQWIDYYRDGDDRIYERDRIVSQGGVPLKNNLIRRLVKNVLGVYRSNWDEGFGDRNKLKERLQNYGACWTTLYKSLLRNQFDELFARTLEEFLISGLAVHKKWIGDRYGSFGCWTDIVSTDRFFWDQNSRDFRGWDMSIIGEIHHIEFGRVSAEFGRTAEEVKLLEELYPGEDDSRICRVVEVWTREWRKRWYIHDLNTGECYVSDQPQEGEGIRVEYDTYQQWIYSYLTPDGRILRRGVSPYGAGGHPFIMRGYPFTDGEIHSFVADIIDQQKLTNRLITMYDWVLRASSKGVLLFPEDSIPYGMELQDVADEWSRFGGVIAYRAKPGVPMPQQVNSTSSCEGIAELLNIQMKMMEDITGITGALQGKLESKSTSGKTLDLQTRNALTSLTDMIKSFDSFVNDSIAMDAAILQIYMGSESIGPEYE